jgi:hypothetical protein
LSQSTNLEELDLVGTEGELCEDDVCMLARLRQLEPVRIGLRGDVRLDFVRRKELKYLSRLAPRAWVDWKAHEWHERDLGIPPYRIGFDGLKYSWVSLNVRASPMQTQETVTAKVAVTTKVAVTATFLSVYRCLAVFYDPMLLMSGTLNFYELVYISVHFYTKSTFRKRT